MICNLDERGILYGLMKQHKITQRQLATEVGLCRTYVCEIVSGRRQTSESTLRRIRDTLEKIINEKTKIE